MFCVCDALLVFDVLFSFSGGSNGHYLTKEVMKIPCKAQPCPSFQGFDCSKQFLFTTLLYCLITTFEGFISKNLCSDEFAAIFCPIATSEQRDT